MAANISYGDLLEAKADLLMAQSDLTCVDVEYQGDDLAAERVRRTVEVSKKMRHLVNLKHQRRVYSEKKQRRMRRYKEAQIQAKRAAKHLLAMKQEAGNYMPDDEIFNSLVQPWLRHQQKRTATPAGGTAGAVPGFEVHDTEFYECTEQLDEMENFEKAKTASQIRNADSWQLETEGSDDTADTEKYEA